MTESERNFEDIKKRIVESNLDSDDKIRAIYRLDLVYAENGGRCRRPDVDSFFTWEEQPEGHAFWSNVNGEIGYEPTWERVNNDPFGLSSVAATAPVVSRMSTFRYTIFEPIEEVSF